MRRIHLFEFEDLPWLPKPIRDGGTDLLDLLFARVGMYRPLVGKLLELIDATGARDIVDLGSGGGGGALAMRASMREQGRDDLRLTLTDRYPNAAAAARVRALGDARVSYYDQPVDAFAVPSGLRGIRTMYGALHHFQPEAIQRILARAIEDRAPIALFDIAASPVIRKTPAVLAPVLAIPNMLALAVAAMVLTPFVRPLRVSSLALTYLLPAIPGLFAWDGTVSALRAYSPDELLAIAHTVPRQDSYVWDTGHSGAALCLTGRPKA